MNLIAIAVGVLGVVLLAHSLARQSVIRALARELRAIRDREQELRIRLDDLSSKLNNALTQVNKSTGIYDKRIAVIEDRLQRPGTGEKPLQLETEADIEMRERLARLEQLALGSGGSVNGKEESASPATESPHTTAPASESPPSSPKSLTSLTYALSPWRERIAGAIGEVLDRTEAAPKRLPELLQKTMREFGLGPIFSKELDQRLQTLMLTPGELTLTDVQSVLRSALMQHLGPQVPFGVPHEDSDHRLRTLLVVGGEASGKSMVTAGIGNILVQENRKVLLADCTGVGMPGRLHLAELVKGISLEVVTAVVNTKPHHVAYKAIHRAQDEHFEIVLLDTPPALTGRNKVTPEVTAIASMIAREHPHPPHETLLVLNAADVKGALAQGKALMSEGSFSGLALTHLDGLSEPGAVLAIRDTLGIPLWFLSYGPNLFAVSRFTPLDFTGALIGGTTDSAPRGDGERPEQAAVSAHPA
jgi:fused signal recognition particle receptor